MAVNVQDFSVVFAKRGFAAFEAEIMDTALTLEAAGRAQAAQRLRSAYQDYLADLERVSFEIARRAETYIKEEEWATRVRPRPTGANPPLLEDHVGKSEALTDLPGSVAVNDMDELDREVPWWWTQEEGYSGHVGHEIKGFFLNAGFTGPVTRPDPNQRGVHPLFLPSQGGGTGTIQNPIPARRFVQHGAQQAEAEWHREIAAARRRFMSRIAPLLRGP